MLKRCCAIAAFSLLIGIFVGRSLAPYHVAAQTVPIWARNQVLPIVIVKPDIGGFSPVRGTSIGNIWSKDSVVPMILVKPDIGGFTPVEGTSIGNVWSKDVVKPVIIVEPTLGGFSPSNSPSVF